MIQRFLPSRSRGGVGHFAHGLCNALGKRGHTVTVFSQDPPPQDALYHVNILPPSHPVMGYHCDPLTFPFQVAKRHFSAFDVIHAQGDEHLISRNGPPVIRTMHGSALAEALYNGWRLRSPKRFFMHLYFYGCELLADVRADAVVVVSNDTRRYYPRVHAMIPNGVDLEHFSRQQGERTGHPTILFVGELGSRKRGKLLCDVVRRIVKPRIPDVELWLVCPEKAEGDGVRWFGLVDSDMLAKLYRETWVFCLPSSYEGFGRPYVEAMASGTPVVATHNPGAREVLENGRYGLVVPDAELGETLCTLLTHADLRADYARRGAERAKVYAWETVTEQYEQVYAMVLRKRAAGEAAL